MSPGATFERVYHELKRMLAEGELPPGTPIEPALIGKQIASSITPVRDALHRLTGERLVEAPNHNGFRVPMPTEAGLRDLYEWHARLLLLAISRRLAPIADSVVADLHPEAEVSRAFSRLSVAIAVADGSAEMVHAVENLNDRLAPLRAIELQLLDDIHGEYRELARAYLSSNRRQLMTLLRSHHRRRIQITAQVVAKLHAGSRTAAS